jgi:Tol biopolymer transport system component
MDRVAGEFDAEHLLSVEVATRRVNRLPDAGNHMFSPVRWLGDRLLFAASETGSLCCQGSQLYTTAPDGTGIKGFGSFWVAGSMRPELSPKGSKVAVAWSVREGGFGADYRNEIALLDASGRARRDLTSAFPRPFYSAYDPAWAPDDRHLAFTLSLCPYAGCEPKIRSVVVVDTRDEKAVPAFIAYGGSASWSPVR